MKPNIRRILFTVTNDLSYDQRMIRIASSLAGKGLDVLLIGRQKKTSVPLEAKPFRQHRFKMWFQKGKLFYLEYNLRLFFFLLLHPFDLVGSVDLDTLLPCYLAARLKRKKCYYDAHEYFTEVPEVIDRPLVKFIWGFIGKLIIPHVDKAYTVSASLQKLFSKQYGLSFGLIRNLPLLRDSSETRSASLPGKVLLYQGVLNKGRGLEKTIEAMVHLPEIEFWLAGEGDLSRELRELVRLLQLEDRVRFLGYLSPDVLQKTTRKATIGLNLLEHLGQSYYYSLANKTFDYIHAGVPALHSNFPEYRLLNEEWEMGILLEGIDVSQIVNAIQSLLSGPQKYQQLVKNCLRAKKVLNWEKEEKELFRIYEV